MVQPGGSSVQWDRAWWYASSSSYSQPGWRPNPFHARKAFPEIDDLAQSIRVHSFTSRLGIRLHAEIEDNYQLVYGERCLHAAIVAGPTDVPCETVRQSDVEKVEIGLAENIQRQDLTPLEEAHALKELWTTVAIHSESWRSG